MLKVTLASSLRAALLAASVLAAPAAFAAEMLPDGKLITPLAIPGSNRQFLNPGLANYPNFIAGQALRQEVSPNGRLLAVLTAGQNSLDDANGNTDVAASTQFIFLYDISGINAAKPVLKQVIQQVNAHVGLIWSPDSATLFAAGGNDDAVYVYQANAKGVWGQTNKIALGHSATHGNAGIGGFVQPSTSGLAISADGKTLVAVNYYNDSISVVDVATGAVRYEQDLRPYAAGNEGTSGVAGGEYPFGVVLVGKVAYVSSARDRQVVAMDISSPTGATLVKRIPLAGNGLGMAVSKTGMLYVAQDNADAVAVIDTSTNAVVASIDVRAPAGILSKTPQTGAAPISVRLDRAGTNLYVVNAGANSVAVVRTANNRTLGLVPTGYEPTDVAFSGDNNYIYIINGKSNTGPNPGHLYGNLAAVTSVTLPGGNAAAAAAARASNQYQFQLEKSSLVTAPVSGILQHLGALTAQVITNDNYSPANNAQQARTMLFLRNHIRHIIYVVKENRTFDQMLGDLNNGSNGDPTLTMFGKAITPSQHDLATQFVTLDNFQDPGDGSMDGWSWATQARVTNTEAIAQQLNYAFVNRGQSYDTEGTNRNVPVGLATVAGRDAATGGAFSAVSATLKGGTANLLPGTANHTATDSQIGKQMGYIWNAALDAGLTVRNYGFLTNNIGAIMTSTGAGIDDPYKAGVVQVAALDPNLLDKTDVYFRGYDQAYPDLWRINEWTREFNQFVANGTLPNLELVRVSHDHTGSFSSALAGVNTPETQQADDDYAVGKLVETVAKSPYADSTLIIVTEDDCQDGPDHVDSHRATAYMAGPYLKRGAVVSTHYSQVNVLRTIEDILGTKHVNLNTATQAPMTDVFDITNVKAAWKFTATASTVLKTTSLSLASADSPVRFAAGADVTPTHDAAYWDARTQGFDFTVADMAPPDLYNHVLWEGIKGSQPYPKLKSAMLGGVSLSGNN